MFLGPQGESSSTCCDAFFFGLHPCIWCSSNSIAQILLRMFLNPGESLLVEQYTSLHLPHSTLNHLHIVDLPIEVDSQGIIPTSLENLLAQRLADGLPIPKLLYTIPNGQNPTGEKISGTCFLRTCILAYLKHYIPLSREEAPSAT